MEMRRKMPIATLLAATLCLPVVVPFAPGLPVHRTGGHRPAQRIRMDAIPRAEFLQSLAVPLAGAAAFRVGAALAVIGQPRVPPLTGTYTSVGVRVVRIDGGCRAKVFYPALSRSSDEQRDGAYCTDGRSTSDSMAGLVGFRQLGLSFLLAHLATASSGAQLEATPDAGARFPLLVYSHGFGGNMDMATYLMRQIASHGAVVVALDHTDGTASTTRLADGTDLTFSPRMMSGEAQLERRAAELIAASQPNALPDDIPVDPSRVFLGGHSYGGPACLLAAAQVTRPKHTHTHVYVCVT